MHLGNTTTNKAGSAHARLKKYVPNSLGDLYKNRGEIDRMLINLFSEIHKDFQQSIIFKDERWKGIVLWSELQGNISREALGYLLDEVCRAEVIGADKARCGCVLRSTTGLSCACSLAKIVKEGEPIRLADLHVHWRRLQFDVAHFEADKDADLSLVPDWDVLQV
jgi:alpha-glucosidase